MTEEIKKPEVKKARKKKTARKSVRRGVAYIQASYNNTLITLADNQGNVLGWASAGNAGFKGPKKATPYAAGIIVKQVLDKIKEVGLQEVDVRVKGIGAGREAAVRALNANGLKILSIWDVTPVPHNGCRSPRPRRV
ncbi:MAG: 30S ribosomal protein S11 [bacterium]